jgi:hypothetical protein
MKSPTAFLAASLLLAAAPPRKKPTRLPLAQLLPLRSPTPAEPQHAARAATNTATATYRDAHGAGGFDPSAVPVSTAKVGTFPS